MGNVFRNNKHNQFDKYIASEQQIQNTLTVNFEILRLVGHCSGQSAAGGSHSDSALAVEPCSNIGIYQCMQA